MSTPRCLRIAIEACRPCKTSALPLRTRVAHSQGQRTRGFTSSGPTCLPVRDITSGFPMPELGSRKIQELPEIQEEEASEPPIVHPSPKQTPQRSVKAPASRKSRQDNSKSPEEEVAAIVSRSVPSQPQAEGNLGADATATSEPTTSPNVPPNVLAAYRTPLRHPLTHGIPVAQLQLRSYSARNLEFYADFAVRAAYYLGLPCTGPAPLPHKRERWTVLKSNFINKKAQENFERITLKRLVTVFDGQPEVVEVWLAFLRKWQFYGVGMKANVWQWEGVDVASKMDRDFSAVEKELDDKLRLFGFNKSSADKNDLLRIMARQGQRQVGVGLSEIREQSRETRDPY